MDWLRVKINIDIDVKVPQVSKISNLDVLPWLTLGLEVARFISSL